ncbi:CRISPR-associated protein Cas4 [Cytophagaceae bacterium DM2B3-1]|uniref:CRISPR-associated protein Cas4 n=1 Tax=Xanthocytophaga flava TaxID=3048013 RepID=A0ABT7CTC5_9BACT|nr:CRISPR-associated protein Cas4 [Xanthocytophaga flavus]MDJ1496931.1 CRISPR-associated protein Cas4 [Xanthocytophaga flavus]
MQFTASHIIYYLLCHRKLWLFHNNIQMEHTSDTVYEGKLIGETTYQQRAERYTQLEMEGIKIDFFDAKAKVIHETKKSDKAEQAHIAQVRYYQYVLERNGIAGTSAILEYPKLRKTELIPPLTHADRLQMAEWEKGVQVLIESQTCPPRIKKSLCKSCSYYEFCYVAEAE